jgi:hypothetical protein
MQKSNHEWSKDALFAKAQLYAEAMEEHEDSNWQFGLWSAFTLEMLIRSAVAKTSPALLADNQDWNNILYGLGGAPKKQKFVAKSAAITELVTRAEDLYAEFNREHANFCVSHFARRNSEVHTGNLPFENMGSSSWLPMFYAVSSVLVLLIGESLESLFGAETATRAIEEIAALQDDTAKAVRGTISAHKTVWEQKSDSDKASAQKLAETTSIRHYGHRTPCPACACTALMQGKAAGAAKRTVDEHGIVERQVMRPEAIYCVACGLKISGYSKLLSAGLGDTFISTSHYDAMEYFEIDLDEHVRSMMEDDNNEY